MMKCRLRTDHNGRESLILGLTPSDLAELLADGVMMIDGASFGLDDKAIVLMFGADHREMLAKLEENLPVKFPRDEHGNYLPVNA